jgi:hypothetical protein
MRQWKDGFKTREEAKEYLKRVREDGFVAKIVVDHSYGEYDEALPFVVITTDFRSPKHALTESYNRIKKLISY